MRAVQYSPFYRLINAFYPPRLQTNMWDFFESLSKSRYHNRFTQVMNIHVRFVFESG